MDIKLPQGECSGGAEALLTQQPNSSISVTYHSLFGPHDDLMLLEVDEMLLPEVLHQRVTLRGQPDEDAVLCTQTKTYAVKFVGTSNSVFLIPPSDNETQVCNNKDDGTMKVASVFKIAPGCMELVEVAPKLDKLKWLLSRNPCNYREAQEMDTSEGSDNNKTNVGLYRWDDLVDRLQASDEELRSGLRSLDALEINGYWRILDDETINRILKMLIKEITLNDWSIDALDEDEVVKVLETDDYPRNIAKHCLQVYSTKVEEGVYGKCTWKFDERRVCVQLARKILKKGKMKLETFMDKWIRKADGMHVSFDMLEGEVLVEKFGMETFLYSFSVSSLPSTPAERFTLLFKERAKWEWKDLEPYVRDIKVPGLSLEGLLLKYTRRTQPTMDAEPVFSTR